MIAAEALYALSPPGSGEPTVTRMKRAPQTPQQGRPTRTCPKCGSPDVHRSHRRLVELLTTWFYPGQRMYRCQQCQARYWDTKHGPSRFTVGSSVSPAGAAPPAPDTRRRQRDTQRSAHRLARWVYRTQGIMLGEAFVLRSRYQPRGEYQPRGKYQPWSGYRLRNGYRQSAPSRKYA